jgi:hypothetical protein
VPIRAGLMSGTTLDIDPRAMQSFVHTQSGNLTCLDRVWNDSDERDRSAAQRQDVQVSALTCEYAIR